MPKRDFTQWFDTFKETIADFKYYTNFKKVYRNVEEIKIQLHMLNSLIGSKNIESEFESLVKQYPETLKCIPILLAVRMDEIKAWTDGELKKFPFKNPTLSIDEYKLFMRETGLFDLLQNHIINNLYDYVTGVETGLDSNARKNRGGDAMEDVVESFIKKEGFARGVNYFKEMYNSEVSKMYDIDLSNITNNGKGEKRWDYVVKTENCIYLIEVNFYSGGGSKLNETARSYKAITSEVAAIKGAKFIWITDGQGWKSARKNLEETFDVLDNLYNINDLQNGVLKRVFV